MFARLDAARCASWHQGQAGTRVADEIILDVTVVKTHCAEVALAMFVWLAVLASRPLGLRCLVRGVRGTIPQLGADRIALPVFEED